MKIAIASTVVALSVIAGSGARADSCGPLTVAAAMEMASDATGLVVVPALLGNVRKGMVVDTGSGVSDVSSATVSELHLSTFQNQFVNNQTGNKFEKAVGISPFGIGSIATKTYTFRVKDTWALGAAGSIGADLLVSYDADFDFGGNKFNLVNQNHCDGQVVYWKADAVVIVPIEVARDGRVTLTVMVDGHPFKALLSTGLTGTTVTAATASSLLGSSTPTVHALALEGLAINNPHLVVADKLRDAAGVPLDPALDVNMTLGLDVLKRLHLYIAYKEHKLYITPR